MPTHFPDTVSSTSIVDIPETFAPIGTGGYIGLTLLFSLPVVGLVAALAFAFGSKNENRRAFGRAGIVFHLIGYGLLAFSIFVHPLIDLATLRGILTGLPAHAQHLVSGIGA